MRGQRVDLGSFNPNNSLEHRNLEPSASPSKIDGSKGGLSMFNSGLLSCMTNSSAGQHYCSYKNILNRLKTLFLPMH